MIKTLFGPSAGRKREYEFVPDKFPRSQKSSNEQRENENKLNLGMLWILLNSGFKQKHCPWNVTSLQLVDAGSKRVFVINEIILLMKLVILKKIAELKIYRKLDR